MPTNPAKPEPPPKSQSLTWAVLGATAVVVAVTVYVATHKGRPTGPLALPAASPTPQPDLADQVLAKVAGLLQSASAVPAQNPRARQAAYDMGLQLMQAYVQGNPDDVRVRPALADLLLEVGRPDEARRVADDLLALRPRSPDGLWAKGKALRALGDADANRFLDEAAEVPDAGATVWSRYGLELLARRQPRQAEAYFRKARQDGAFDAVTLCALARFALQRKELDEAGKLLAEAVRDESAGCGAWKLLAAVQAERGQLDEAAASLQQALLRLPRSADDPASAGIDQGDLLMDLGRVRVAQKRWRDAAETFTRAADDPLLRPRASLLAAQAWFQIGSYSLALARIDEAARLAPADPAVAEWRTKIEDAHFVRPGASSSPTP